MIVAAGEALVDLIPHPVPGGGPMNVAVAAARLGVPTAFLGRVSTDEYGRLIWTFLEESGVDLRVAERGSEPTCRAVVEGDPPTFTFHGDGTADRMLQSNDLAALGPGPHILHGGTLGMFRRPAAELYAQLAESHDGLVSLDPNARPQIVGPDGKPDWMSWFGRWYAAADLVRLSDADLNWIWPDTEWDVAATALRADGVACVVITTADGATIYTDDGTRSVAARRVDVVDSVGAGDAFCAGMLAQLHERGVRTGETLRAVDLDVWIEILDFAAQVASISVSRPGADPPWRSELI